MSTSLPHPDTLAPPPSYEAATSSTGATTPARVSTDEPGEHRERNGIPPDRRRSMEDENRPLPPGWVRQFDAQEQHQFFVDTNANPPRSIWVHPYDDPTFLSTLSPEERKKHTRRHRTMTLEDLAAESSDDEAHTPSNRQTQQGTSSAALPPRDDAPKGIHKFGRKMKDKITASTHSQREAERRKREEAERRAYQAHMQMRQAMVKAMQTGQPQFLCKDREGRDVYIEPPGGPRGGYGAGAYGYSPFAQQGGPYANPNNRFMRPVDPYGRRMGYGYGGGIGAPVAAGFLGGALLGGLLF